MGDPGGVALSNRNSTANAIFGAMGAGDTTMGDVNAQSTLGSYLGAEKGGDTDKALGNASQLALASIAPALMLGGPAGVAVGGGVMLGQETVGLIEDKKKQWAGERKTDRMESSFEKTQLGNENFKDMPYLNAQQMILKNEERVAKENAGKFKKAVEEGRGDEQAGPGGLITNKQALESANRQVAEKQVAFENSLNPGQKETIKQFESIKAGREQFNQQQAAAKRQKAEKYQSYRDKYGEDLSDEDIQLFENTKNRKAIFNKEGKREGVDILPGPFEQKLIDKQEKAKEAQEAATQQATIPIAGTASGVGAMTLSDKPQTFGSMIDEEIQQEKLGGASYDPFADMSSTQATAAASVTPITGDTTKGMTGNEIDDGINQFIEDSKMKAAWTPPKVVPYGVDSQGRVDPFAGFDDYNFSGTTPQGLINSIDNELASMGYDFGGLTDKFKFGTQKPAQPQQETGDIAQKVQSDKSASAGGSVGIPGAIYGGMVADPKKHKPVKEFTRDQMGTTVGSDAFKGGLWSPQALGIPAGDESMKQMYDTVEKNFDSHRQGGRNAAPNIPAQVAAQSRTSNLLGAGQNNGNGTNIGGMQEGGQGGGQGSGPIQVNTTGTQEIIVRLPDLQGIINQSISSLIYNTVGDMFKNIAGKFAGISNFDEMQSAFSQGYEEKMQAQINNTSTVNGK